MHLTKSLLANLVHSLPPWYVMQNSAQECL
jgi:hypothetical protein